MVSSWGGIPKGSVPAPKHHQVAGPERPVGGSAGGVWGKGGQPLPSPQTVHLTQRILSELLAGRGPQRLFYPEGLCTEYK